MYHARHIAARLHRLLSSFPVVVVAGARQTGKTTLVRHELADWLYVVFDPTFDVAGARSDPDLFLRNHPSPVILDEIQYAPELISAVKRCVDSREGRPGQFVLTGSQQWQVLRNVAESLAGRAAFLDLEGLSLAERTDSVEAPDWLHLWMQHPGDFLRADHLRASPAGTLNEILWRGSLPRACAIEHDLLPDFWAGYIRTYVERDARLLADLSDWQQFGLFLRLLCSLTAQEVNYSHLGRDIGITPQTAKRWLRVLQGTYQWYELPAFGSNMVKRVSAKPKGYVSDSGLACYLLQLSSPRALAGHTMYGPLFETFVAAEIRKQLALRSGSFGLHHWRSAGGAEVDILVERDGLHCPIEIKGSTRVDRRDASGIAAFQRAYSSLRMTRGLIVAPVDTVREVSDHAVVVPWDLVR